MNLALKKVCALDMPPLILGLHLNIWDGLLSIHRVHTVLPDLSHSSHKKI